MRGIVDRGRELADGRDSAGAEGAGALLADGRQQGDVVRGLGLVPAAVVEATADALGPADGLVLGGIGGPHAQVPGELLEDGRLPFVRDGHEGIGPGVDFDPDGALTGQALEEQAVDLELQGDAAVAPGEDVARELGVADAVAAGGGVVDEEVGLADELDGGGGDGEGRGGSGAGR